MTFSELRELFYNAYESKVDLRLEELYVDHKPQTIAGWFYEPHNIKSPRWNNLDDYKIIGLRFINTGIGVILSANTTRKHNKPTEEDIQELYRRCHEDGTVT